MADGRTAEARLERLLHVLPAAMRERGARLADLAEQLGTSPERIMEDIDELTARCFYRGGGWADDIVVGIEGDRVRVRHASGFERPVRLSRDETLCLALALRGGAAPAHVASEPERARLLERAERHLGQRGGGEASPEGGRHSREARSGEGRPADPPTEDERLADAPADERAAGAPSEVVVAADPYPDIDGVRETLIRARTECRPCALWYVKPGADDGTVRMVHPYAVAYAEGAWYTVAHCTLEDATRVFRLDRVLACDVADGTFERPEDFRPEDYIEGGRVFFADDAQGLHDVRVRYSPRIARWIRERARWEPERMEESDDGSVVVRHAVADPAWAVGHVLQYGGEAEIVEPEEIRALVRQAMRELVAGVGDGRAAREIVTPLPYRSAGHSWRERRPRP